MDDFLNRQNKTITVDYVGINNKKCKFTLDLNTFEDLIENFNPKDSIPKILRVNTIILDAWCFKAYNSNYSDTYDFLFELSLSYQRKAINKLANSGNGKALDISTQYLSKIAKQEANLNAKVVIVGTVPKDE